MLSLKYLLYYQALNRPTNGLRRPKLLVLSLSHNAMHLLTYYTI